MAVNIQNYPNCGLYVGKPRHGCRRQQSFIYMELRNDARHTDPLAQPQYTIALAVFAMSLGALCLYGTPFISLYVLSGRVYESVAAVWTKIIV